MTYFTGWKWSLRFLALYKYSVWGKLPLIFFEFSKNLQKLWQKNYIPGIFWAFKRKFHIIFAANYIALFLPDTSNCFFLICIIPCIHICFYYFLILCFYFHLLFLNFLAMKHILQFTIFHIISLQTAHNIMEIRNTS